MTLPPLAVGVGAPANVALMTTRMCACADQLVRNNKHYLKKALRNFEIRSKRSMNSSPTSSCTNRINDSRSSTYTTFPWRRYQRNKAGCQPWAVTPHMCQTAAVLTRRCHFKLVTNRSTTHTTSSQRFQFPGRRSTVLIRYCYSTTRRPNPATTAC